MYTLGEFSYLTWILNFCRKNRMLTTELEQLTKCANVHTSFPAWWFRSPRNLDYLFFVFIFASSQFIVERRTVQLFIGELVPSLDGSFIFWHPGCAIRYQIFRFHPPTLNQRNIN